MVLLFLEAILYDRSVKFDGKPLLNYTLNMCFCMFPVVKRFNGVNNPPNKYIRSVINLSFPMRVQPHHLTLILIIE